MTICGSCSYWCCTLPCCRRCKCRKKREESSDPDCGCCCGKKEKESRDLDASACFRLVVFLFVSLILCAVALLTSLVGSTTVGSAVDPFRDLFGGLSRLFFAVSDAMSLFLEALVQIRELFSSSGFPLPEYINVEQIQNWISTADSNVCIAQRAGVVSTIILVVIVILGQGVAFAAALIVAIGLVRSRRNLVSTGSFLIVFSMILTGLLLAISAPLSVYMDDLCFTLSDTNDTVLLGCSPNNSVALFQATISVINFANVVANDNLNQICLAVRGGKKEETTNFCF